jgi:hypothetical protein
VSGPSKETEVEALLRRLVEATERIADVLTNANNPNTGCIDIMAHRPRDEDD